MINIECYVVIFVWVFIGEVFSDNVCVFDFIGGNVYVGMNVRIGSFFLIIYI